MSISQDVYTSLRAATPRWLRGTAVGTVEQVGEWTGTMRMTPTFLIVGGQRCGTNSLYEYLVRHPNVARALPGQEVHYFDLNFHRGLRWYHGHFPIKVRSAIAGLRTGMQLIAGESSPYYMFHPLAARRIAEVLPHAKLLVLLRDPVDRAFSHYQHERARGVETLSLEDAIASEPDRLCGEEERICREPTYNSFNHQHFSYVARGEYIQQLERLYSLFPEQNILVVISEELFSRPPAAFSRALAFLGLSPYSLSDYPRFNPGRYSQLDAGVRRALAARFAEANERLSRFLGVALPWD